MPPKVAPTYRGGSRGGARGGPPRGVGATRGGGSVGSSHNQPPSHITTVGVRRPDYGTAGRVIKVEVNCFPATIPDQNIHHYDIAIDPSNLPARLNLEIIKTLQSEVAPGIFTPKGSYDGKKNLFAAGKYALAGTNGDSQEFNVPLPQQNGGSNPDRAPKIFKVKVTRVSTINPELLQRFVKGQQSHDNEAVTAITACNVALRMEPNLNYPFNIRSFFIPDLENRRIGGGMDLWRGLFQSLRPGISRMFVNVDIATGVMYKSGSLLELCLDVLETNRPAALDPKDGLSDSDRIRVQRFVSGVRVVVKTTGAKQRVLRALTKDPAHKILFEHEGRSITVAQYFHKQLGRPLHFPNLICAEIGKGAIIPLELCTVLPGQIIRKQIPSHKTADVLSFATKKPQDRFALIKQGTGFLQYGQSEYIRSLGMSVDTANGLIQLNARKLDPPALKYGRGASVTVSKGSWNMKGKQVFSACPPITSWAIVVFDPRFRYVDDMKTKFKAEAANMGIQVADPVVHLATQNFKFSEHLLSAGKAAKLTTGKDPQLLVVVLPNGGDEIYSHVKHFGDIARNIATQCLKSQKCGNAKPQYWANVLLKVNVKLGGTNAIIDPQSSPFNDAANPTIIMGADVQHPAPGAEGKPSFTALVANVDSHATKYIATDRVQTGREEIIEDLQSMTKACVEKFISYRTIVEKQRLVKPRRMIFFRDGVSEGQFAHVLERELPLIKAGLKDAGVDDCKITLIVVGKRHHLRMNAVNPGDRDDSGNAPAGTVIDREVAHPTEFDYYLLSHGGLLGTSRPSHYSVLSDENEFTADGLQKISYYLCHVYARATRSVSIPAPVYYADLVCGRGKHHYDPSGAAFLTSDDSPYGGRAQPTLEDFKRNFKPLSPYAQTKMFFS